MVGTKEPGIDKQFSPRSSSPGKSSPGTQANGTTFQQCRDRSDSPRRERSVLSHNIGMGDQMDLETAKAEIKRLKGMLSFTQNGWFDSENAPKSSRRLPPEMAFNSRVTAQETFSALVHHSPPKPPTPMKFSIEWTVRYVKIAIFLQFFQGEKDISNMTLLDGNQNKIGPDHCLFLNSSLEMLKKGMSGEMLQIHVNFQEKPARAQPKESCKGEYGFPDDEEEGREGSVAEVEREESFGDGQSKFFQAYTQKERAKANTLCCLLTGEDNPPLFFYLPARATLEESLVSFSASTKKAIDHALISLASKNLESIASDMSVTRVEGDVPLCTTRAFKDTVRVRRVLTICGCPGDDLIDGRTGKYEEPNASTDSGIDSSLQNITIKGGEESDSDAETLSVVEQEFDSEPEDEEENNDPQEEVLKKSDVDMEIHYEGRTFALQAPRLHSIRNVIESVCEIIRKESTIKPIDPESAYLTMKGTHFVIRDLETAIHCHPMISYFEKKNSIPILEVVSAEVAANQKDIETAIGVLVQASLAGRADRISDNDASDCRIKMARIISCETSHITAVGVEVTSAPLPDFLPDRFTIRVYSPGDDVNTKTLQVESHHTIQEILQSVCKKIRISTKEELNHEEYTFKICGREQYFVDTSAKMNNVVYIRECLKNMSPIVLTMVRREELPSILPPESERLEKMKETATEPVIDASSLDQAPDMYGDDDVVSLLELKRPFEFKIIAVRNVYDLGQRKIGNGDFLTAASTQLYCEAGLYHGGVPLCKPQQSKVIRGTVWNEWLRSDERMCDIPEETRVCITLMARRDGRNDYPLGHVNYRLFNFKDHLLSGTVTLKMWPDGKANPIGTCVENLRSSKPVRITLGFHVYPQPIAFPRLEPAISVPMLMEGQQPSSENKKDLLVCIAADPLQKITKKQKDLLWKYREYCLVNTNKKALVKVLQSVHWGDFRKVQETYRLLALWPTLDPVDALELLDAKFADKKVREYAVKCLEGLPDAKLKEYLLQLVQVLKYEPHHYSALAAFLMRRALLNPLEIGHTFFWHLKAEMHVPEIAERYGLLLELYLTGCGQQREVFLKQKSMLSCFEQVSDTLKKVPQSRRKEVMHAKLAELDLPETFRVPVDPTFVAKGLIIEKCKTMDSAKAPLWLVFENADRHGDPITVLFKAGDDLRQDILTLQMLNIMDHLWKEEGDDLHLTPYKVISTGEDQGMIEVVLNSATVANIQKAAGGVTGAFKQTTILNWLKEANNIPQSKDLSEDIVKNFMHSCAGYCVATYVLGIGDRHNDNIMVNKNGHLFHIDFGHFLGNFKTFAGVARERAPFVFTQEFAHVMGGAKSQLFKEFVSLCCRGFLVLRKHANIFINLFAMMLSTGIPELQSEADIRYLRDAFAIGQSEQAAADHFAKLIRSALGTKATNINFAIHIWAHSD